MPRTRSSPLLLAVLGVVVTGLLAFVALRARSHAPGQAPVAPRGDGAGREPAAIADAGAGALRAEAELSVGASSAAARLVVQGRAVDTSGATLAGLRVTLTSPGETWRLGDSAPRQELPDGTRAEGFETATRDDGRFTFDVPASSAVTIVLQIDPRPPLGTVVREFGEGWTAAPPLAPGEHDLGDLVVPRHAAVEGVVVRADGRPVAGATVTCPAALLRGEPVSARTQPDGSFLLAGLPPLRPVELAARAPGFADTTGRQVELPSSGIARDVRIVLVEGDRVDGLVVDERDAPVAGVRLDVHAGLGTAQVRSAGDGTFAARVHAGLAPSVSLADDAYEALAVENGRPTVVRVRARPVMTFVVVDDATGAPIEVFGLALGSNDQVDFNPGDQSTPPLAHHPQGEVRAPISAQRAAVRVVAAGHADLDVPVDPDTPDGDRQTLRMRRESVLLGGVAIAGQPLRGATVVLERGTRHPDSTRADASRGLETWNADLRDHEGRARRRRSDAQGRFRFGGLPAGSWRLRVESPRTTALVLDPILLRAETELDVGVLEAELGGAIRGVARTPPGVSPVAMRVDAFGPTPDSTEITREDGAFLLSGLTPGHYGVQLQTGYDLHLGAAVEQTRTLVVAGRAVDVEFDLRSRAVCRPRVVVTTNGAPLPGARVLAAYGFELSEHLPVVLGVTDAEGAVSALAPGRARVRYTVTSPCDVPLGTSDLVVLPESGAPTIPVEVPTGELTVQLPAGLRVPARARLAVNLERDASPRIPVGLFFVTAQAGDGERSWGGYPSTSPLRSWDGGEVALGAAAAGTWKVLVHVNGRDEPASGAPPSLLAWSGTIRVEPGGTTVIRPEP